MLEIIKESLTNHQDGIMRFTLGDDTDEYGEKYADVYTIEWGSHKRIIARAIETIYKSSLPLTEDMIVGIIVNEWFNSVGCDIRDLNYYGLVGVAVFIMKDIEEYKEVE